MATRIKILIMISLLLILIQPELTFSQLRDASSIQLERIETYVVGQVELGPRYPGSEGSGLFDGWLRNIIVDPWIVEAQTFEYEGIDLNNYLITTNGEIPNYLFLAHWDTRAVADKDPNPFLKNNPMIGANDGASGVAGLLELIHHIPEDVNDQIGFLLVDGEDQGSNGMENWGWIIGSKYFADSLTEEEIDQIKSVILLDMIGDDDLNIPYELNSDDTLVDEIWSVASDLGYGNYFLDERGYSLIDDHVPFLDLGIPAIDIIDFDYPEHHTTNDDLDHISYESIGIVTDVVLQWLLSVVNSNASTANIPSSSSIATSNQAKFHVFPLIGVIILIPRIHSRYASLQ